MALETAELLVAIKTQWFLNDYFAAEVGPLAGAMLTGCISSEYGMGEEEEAYGGLFNCLSLSISTFRARVTIEDARFWFCFPLPSVGLWVDGLGGD